MGCWNKTCGLTNLPIFCDDKVVWFLLVQNPYAKARTCYASSMWELVPIPVYGTYDDYGFITPDEGQEWKLELFQKHFGNSLVEVNDKIRPATNPFTSFEVLNESLRNDSYGTTSKRYTNNGNTEVTSMFGDFMVHAKSFEELTAQSHSRWYDEDSIDRAYVEKMYTHYMNWRDTKISEYEALEDGNSADRLSVHFELFSLRRGIMSDNQWASFADTLDDKPTHSHDFAAAGVMAYWSGEYGSMYGYTTTGVIRTLTNFGRNPLSIKEQVDVAMLDSVMMGLRKQYTPPGHEGSQDGIGSIHTQFVTTFQNRIKEYAEASDY